MDLIVSVSSYVASWLNCLTGSPSCSSVCVCGWYTEAVESLTLGRAEITQTMMCICVCVCVRACECVCRPHTSSTTSYYQFLKLVCWSSSTKCHRGRHYQTAWTSFKSLDFTELRNTFQWCWDLMTQKSFVPFMFSRRDRAGKRQPVVFMAIYDVSLLNPLFADQDCS